MTLDELNAAALNCETDTDEEPEEVETKDGEVTDDTDDTDDEEDFESELVEAVELLDKCLRVMERITVKGGRIRSVPVKELTDLLEECGDFLENYPEVG